MSLHGPRDRNQRAFRRLKPEIDRQFSAGRFVAIVDGEIVTDSGSFDELTDELGKLGKNPPDVLVIQAGADYPTEAVIF